MVYHNACLNALLTMNFYHWFVTFYFILVIATRKRTHQRSDGTCGEQNTAARQRRSDVRF